MITVGVDLAAEPSKTVVAVVRWEKSMAAVVQIIPAATDQQILAAGVGAEKVGIDCPLGWPIAFTDFISRHQHGQVRPSEAHNIESRKRLVFRRTDLDLIANGGPNPLSVSADRIGNAAMRVAGLLSVWEAAAGEIDRSGSGLVVEVYPAAALRKWGFNSRKYKGTLNLQARKDLVGKFFDSVSEWLSVPADIRQQCEISDDAFDAVIACLNARAATLPGSTSRPRTQDDVAAAKLEGWIAVPTGEVADLDPRRTGS